MTFVTDTHADFRARHQSRRRFFASSLHEFRPTTATIICSLPRKPKRLALTSFLYLAKCLVWRLTSPPISTYHISGDLRLW